MKDKKAKDSLIAFITAHPEQRLWQAIRNWSGFGFIWSGDKPDMSDAKDTFYETYDTRRKEYER